MREYTIKPGDTLIGIARRELGSAGMWHQLWRINGEAITKEINKRFGRFNRYRKRPEDMIFVGCRLMIPERT